MLMTSKSLQILGTDIVLTTLVELTWSCFLYCSLICKWLTQDTGSMCYSPVQL